MVTNSADTFWPALVIASTQTSEMRPARRAYSIRSCPSSSATKRLNIVFRSCLRKKKLRRENRWASMKPALPAVLSNCRRHVGEQRRHLLTGSGDRQHADQRDQPREQRVFDEVLALILRDETTEQILHDSLLLPDYGY